jgi:eukaryotic-like serine/threonine-protein kinase
VTAPNVAPGSVIAGRFSVRALLGYGGATATFRAVTAQSREVALKLYSPIIGQHQDVMQQLQRYVGEANALPPDLVAHILEAGYDPATAAPFTAMDFIQAPSLAHLVMRRPMTPEEVGAVLRTVAAVLDAAHGREVFHHGLKPTNLFVDPGIPGNVKLTDFAMALPRSVLPTAEGYVLAAPWVAPEQVQASSPAGAAADIFSMALLGFFALTGRPYWRSCQGAVDVASWQRELMSPRTPVSTRAAELGIPLNPAFDAVFSRALAHDPRERFQSAGELAAAFSGFPSHVLDAASTLALPLSPEPAAPPPPDLRGSAMSSPGPQPPPYEQAPAAADASSAPALASMSSSPGRPLETPTPFPIGPSRTSEIVPSRSPWGKAAPVVVGIVAALLLSGAGLAWFVLGRANPPSAAPSPSASSSAAPLAVAENPAEGTSSAEAAADTAPPAAASGTPEAAADAASNDVPVKLSCKPVECGEISIDGKPVKDLEAELRLPPGAYRVSVKRAGYFPKTEGLTVKLGTPVEKAIEIVPVPTSTGAKPCGKFLKRCK